MVQMHNFCVPTVIGLHVQMHGTDRLKMRCFSCGRRFMRKRLIFISAVCALALCACGTQSDPDAGGSAAEETDVEEVTVFPRNDEALVGDTMPFFDNGKMNIFYLADLRDGKTGYHPWALFTTEDYCTFTDEGIVIPYADDVQDQDIALGTGCVMKDQNGLYHAFYTGHNDWRAPKEAVMHATSPDMMNWTKIPEDTFLEEDKYSTEDFRDPYVFYVPEESQYWMLVVTRYEGNGVIVKYTSKDLSKWEDGGVFFEDDMGYGTNMECPTLIRFGSKWYLSFSDQWPDRVVHYRVSDSINGPFKKPDQDTIDGSGFYAGRLETDGENLYCVGWNGTKVGHVDENDYDWAGNMVIHQLKQHEDGTLTPIVNEKVAAEMNHPLSETPLKITSTVKKLSDGYQFAGDEYELVQFDALPDSGRIEADISGFENDDMFGIAFAPDFENVGMLNYVFNIPENRIEFYNTDRIFDDDAQSYIDFDFSGRDSFHITFLLNNGVGCVYVDGEVALTSRMYRSQGTSWQIYGINSTAAFDNLDLLH